TAGNYVLAINFGTTPVPLQTLVDHQTLTPAHPEDGGTLHVLESQLMHFVLSVDPAGTAATAVEEMTLTDPTGVILATLTVAAVRRAVPATRVRETRLGTRSRPGASRPASTCRGLRGRATRRWRACSTRPRWLRCSAGTGGPMGAPTGQHSTPFSPRTGSADR